MAKKADENSVMLLDGSQAMTGNINMGIKLIDNLVPNTTTNTSKDLLFRGSNSNLAERAITVDTLQQFRDIFAKIRFRMHIK